MTDGAVSARQRLLDLYSAAAACQCDVSLYERYEPDAPTALALWASTVGREAKRHPGEYPVIEVVIGKWSITVHLEVNEIRKAG
jgi:hypothetical protein